MTNQEDLYVMRDMVMMTASLFTEAELLQCFKEGIISEEDLLDLSADSVS